jgi:glycosyltransferase involved in cell wall biosynthesis
MIEHGKTGWFLENKDENLCGDELLSIISNTEQINNLKETMLAYIQSQSIENIAVEWENLMQELIEQKKTKKSLKVKKKK